MLRDAKTKLLLLLLLLLLLFGMLEIVLRVMQLRFISVVAMYLNFAILLKD